MQYYEYERIIMSLFNSINVEMVMSNYSVLESERTRTQL